MKTATFYKIQHNINKNLIYIGSTVMKLKLRWNKHKSCYKSRIRDYMLIYRAFDIYGIENFTISEICKKQVNSLKEKEEYEALLIKSINSPLNWCFKKVKKKIRQREANIIRKTKEKQNMNNNRFKCPITNCYYNAPNKSRLNKHLKQNKHPSKRYYKGIDNDYCDICQHQFTSPSAYNNHLKGSNVNKLHMSIINKNAWKCLSCFYQNKLSWHLNKSSYHTHNSKNHPERLQLKNMIIQSSSYRKRKLEDRKAVKQKYANSEKGKITKQRQLNKAKIKCEHGIRPNACKICSPFHCEVCNLTTSKSAKSRHIKSKNHIYNVNPELKLKREKTRRDCIHNKIKEQCILCNPKHCDVCNTLYSKAEYRRHIKTKKHMDATVRRS